MKSTINVSKYRQARQPISSLFVNRWSPRAMSGEELSEKELMILFEAACWAPSAYNDQPWRFLYARKKTENWNIFFNLLGEGNQLWTKKAGVLVVVLSKKILGHNGKPSRTHSFDAGAAWENLALQGSQQNLVVHGMQGFDYDKAKQLLKVPNDYQVEAMIAIGKPGAKEELPEKLQARELPSGRKEITEIAFEGQFPQQ